MYVHISMNQVRITCVLMLKDNAFYFSFYPAYYHFSQSASSFVSFFPHFLGLIPQFYYAFLLTVNFLYLVFLYNENWSPGKAG